MVILHGMVLQSAFHRAFLFFQIIQNFCHFIWKLHGIDLQLSLSTGSCMLQLTTSNPESPPFHVGDTITGQECEGNLASCVFDVGITLEKKSYTLTLDVIFDDELNILDELRGLKLVFTTVGEYWESIAHTASFC